LEAARLTATPIIRPTRQPPPTTLDPEALRTAIAGDVAVWSIRHGRIAKPAGVLGHALAKWLRNDKKFQPSPAWIALVRDAWVEVIREEARAYLAAWDPDHYGAWLAYQQSDRARRTADLEARLAAARSVA
jgi:hypothetical protein